MKKFIITLDFSLMICILFNSCDTSLYAQSYDGYNYYNDDIEYYSSYNDRYIDSYRNIYVIYDNGEPYWQLYNAEQSLWYRILVPIEYRNYIIINNHRGIDFLSYGWYSTNWHNRYYFNRYNHWDNPIYRPEHHFINNYNDRRYNHLDNRNFEYNKNHFGNMNNRNNDFNHRNNEFNSNRNHFGNMNNTTRSFNSNRNHFGNDGGGHFGGGRK
jgi:hypothetical protein